MIEESQNVENNNWNPKWTNSLKLAIMSQKGCGNMTDYKLKQ